jgi:hypothetical protein
MGLKVTIEGARRLAEGVWTARISPRDLTVFGPCTSRLGDWTVVLLGGIVPYDEDRKLLSIEPATAHVLNVGASEQALLLFDNTVYRPPSKGLILGASEQAPLLGRSATPAGSQARAIPAGDAAFLASLPPELKRLGEELLRAVRAEFPGELKYYRLGGRFVEKPDNFWTVKVQPRDRSLVVTVRGRPGSFDSLSLRQLVLKRDMGSYSRFKIREESQLQEAMKVIREARRRRR